MIVAGVLAFIFVFIVALLLFLWWSARRKRRTDPSWAMVTPIDEDYYIVPPGGHSPGEGSPRHSGEEADPFLRRPAPEMQEASQHRVSFVGAAATSEKPGSAANGSLSSSNKSSAASGYGSVLDRPTLGVSVTPPEQRRGQILSPAQLRQLDEETVLPPAADAPSMIPPRLVDPTSPRNLAPLPRMGSKSSITPSIKPWEMTPGLGFSHQTSRNSVTSSMHADQMHEPTVQTARRVRMEDIGVKSPLLSVPQSPEASPPSSSAPSSWKALGLGGLASRLSWFKNSESSSKRNSRTESFVGTPLADSELEAGRALLSAGEPSALRDPTRRFGVIGTLDRPISTVSTGSKSGGASAPSVYHDARSSLPGTPLPTLPPRALATNNETTEFGAWAGAGTVSSQPPAYEDSTMFESFGTSGPNQVMDVLDMPVPRGLSPIASASSLRDSVTTSSLATKNVPLPPGLFPIQRTWSDTTAHTQSVGANVVESGGNRESSGITIDVLEEAPPAAGQSWRALAGEPQALDKRTTFGLVRIYFYFYSTLR